MTGCGARLNGGRLQCEGCTAIGCGAAAMVSVQWRLHTGRQRWLQGRLIATVPRLLRLRGKRLRDSGVGRQCWLSGGMTERQYGW